MRILGKFINHFTKKEVKKVDGRKNNVPTEAANEASAQARRYNAEIKKRNHDIDLAKLKRDELKVKLDTEDKEAELEHRRYVRLEEIRNRYDDDDDEENPIATAITLFMGALPGVIEAVASKQAPPSSEPSTPEDSAEPAELVQLAQNTTEEQFIEIARQKHKDLNTKPTS